MTTRERNADANAVFRPVEAALKRPLRVGALISGGGTTVLNLVDRIRTGSLAAEIPLVISSRADCAGIERSRAAGLNVEVISRQKSGTGAVEGPDEFSQAIFARMRALQVDLVAMAGFLALLSIPDDFRGRVMNIHPSLIPAFCGRGFYGQTVHEAVLARGAKVTGCTVHFADNEFDHGPIILQRTVAVLDDDTAHSLAARVFEAECAAYPEAMALFAAGRLEIAGRRVRIRTGME